MTLMYVLSEVSEAFCTKSPGRMTQTESGCRLGGPRSFHTVDGLTRQITMKCKMGRFMVQYAVGTLAGHLKLVGAHWGVLGHLVQAVPC